MIVPRLLLLLALVACPAAAQTGPEPSPTHAEEAGPRDLPFPRYAKAEPDKVVVVSTDSAKALEKIGWKARRQLGARGAGSRVVRSPRKPKRTKGGYRAYSARDFERLEQIIALKFIGLPLKKIGFFTARTPERLARALRAQRWDAAS